MSEGSSIAVVVLNWNGVSDTLQCLASLRQSVVPLHAIVVDNGSNGDDVEQICASGLADTIIEAGKNLGYAEGNNVGLRVGITQGFEVVGILNNDTEIDPDSFRVLADCLSENEHRALSPDIRYFDEPSRSWFAGGVIDSGWPRHLQPDEILDCDADLQECDCLTGCCIVARRETWENVGLFDPGYFLIFEDSDWSLRARRYGVRLCLATQSVITHKVSRSFESGAPSLLGAFYFVRNGLTFEAKYARKYLPAFALRALIRPSASALLRRRSVRDIVFRWLGALAFVARVKGRAPAPIERLACRLAHQ
jgi:GT2 family glycosyltransferase